ncbi:hypothetical protein M3Y94_01220400 [Aphelenchoides besseyi]|nr:hypothetical protein M3Y94_01220400 [Aphelenchoides besseyi]KAI6219726.1 DJ-1 protein family protein [Aphelenchoides besseyi]
MFLLRVAGVSSLSVRGVRRFSSIVSRHSQTLSNVRPLPIMRHFSPLKTMSKTALIIATDGSEDIELTITSDVLRRANVNVTIAGLQDKDQITLSRQISLNVDKHFKDVVDQDFDAVILPGGPGSKNLAEDKRVGEILKRHEKNGKIIAAICAAPTALKSHGIAPGISMTAYPNVADEIKNGGYKFSEQNVVVDSNVVTSRGPGTAFDFALKIVELLAGDEVSSKVRSSILC